MTSVQKKLNYALTRLSKYELDTYISDLKPGDVCLTLDNSPTVKKLRLLKEGSDTHNSTALVEFKDGTQWATRLEYGITVAAR